MPLIPDRFRPAATSIDTNWNSSMTTGLEHLDVQLKDILEKLTQLSDAIGTCQPRNVVGKLFLTIDGLIHNLYRDEDEAMARYLCSAAELNRRGHGRFLHAYQNLRERYRLQGGSRELGLQARQQLAEWMADHIVLVDTQLLKYVKVKGSSGYIHPP